MIYLEDIPVFFSSTKEHTQQVQLVLTKLWEHGLYTKSGKCEFDHTSIEFLGYVISPKGIMMDVHNKFVQELVVPSPLEDIQSFPRFANPYHRLVKGFSDIAQPLITCTQKQT